MQFFLRNKYDKSYKRDWKGEDVQNLKMIGGLLLFGIAITGIHVRTPAIISKKGGG